MHRISGLKFILIPWRSSDLMKNLMKKKPAAACMKKVMKRPATVEQQTESSGRKADSHGHVQQWRKMRQQRHREKTIQESGMSRYMQDKQQKTKRQALKKTKNVQVRARQAARNGLPYTPKGPPELARVAATAYAAEVKSIEAKEQAKEAMEAADGATKVAAHAHIMASRNQRTSERIMKRVRRLEVEVKTGLETLAETAAQAKRNEERLNADDRARGYVTPSPGDDSDSEYESLKGPPPNDRRGHQMIEGATKFQLIEWPPHDRGATKK